MMFRFVLFLSTLTLVTARLDLTPVEPSEPSFSYCIGNQCDKDKDKDAQAVNDEGADSGQGFCNGNETSFHENPNDCHNYTICFNGTAIEQTCPEDMGYRPDINLCVWEHHVPACRKVRCAVNGIMPDYADCTRYYNCFFGHPYHLKCAEGTRFDSVARQCSSTVPCLKRAHNGRYQKNRKILAKLDFGH